MEFGVCLALRCTLLVVMIEISLHKKFALGREGPFQKRQADTFNDDVVLATGQVSRARLSTLILRAMSTTLYLRFAVYPDLTTLRTPLCRRTAG
jgi:hypothetical protein